MKVGSSLTATLAALVISTVPASATESAPDGRDGEHVIILHGLGRSPRAMRPLADRIREAGYLVHNIGYPSREFGAVKLVEHVRASVALARKDGATRIHFVTHSLGGILVRAYLNSERPAELGRVVMLAPPNHGSEIVDAFGGNPLFTAALGPVVEQLGTGSDGLPQSLGPADFDVGVIAGNASVNPLGSWLVPGDDDGAVSIDSTKLDGMRDFLIVPHSHTFVMRSAAVAAQTIRYLRTGSFLHDDGHAAAAAAAR